ncbi:hypothetical protein Lbys_1345 [Leadbetterella byssophila DSM 17132]|uniref:CobQ/CobB/MinD/ParA nucleotide binding domain-containing protein n=1 Tax=Leadbetterella byssophila (strain DSM 17132 / JCM 16389 / KACC 11308 / NBRC 106382 / 4M15) TaxID=649349 RepID=E4RVK0_LEAB4|nr:hypothetical protein Lbys_1345 [Leadbetterella byssophila DSM 17132]
MIRKFHFILQAKGGVGKSLYTYLRALTESGRSSLFVDVDSSTKTSSRQLTFLGEDRLESISLIDKREVLVRDLFVGYVESVIESSFPEIFMDFGAPESEQFPALIARDLDFKTWCDEVGFQAVFHIIMAAGGAYRPCGEYLEKMVAVLGGQFEVTAWENLNTFKQYPDLSNELASKCQAMEIQHERFGDFDANSLLGIQILDGIRKGYGLEQYKPGARISLRKELREHFGYA